jgi:hypothetical protein
MVKGRALSRRLYAEQHGDGDLPKPIKFPLTHPIVVPEWECDPAPYLGNGSTKYTKYTEILI